MCERENESKRSVSDKKNIYVYIYDESVIIL